MFDLLGGVAKV